MLILTVPNCMYPFLRSPQFEVETDPSVSAFVLFAQDIVAFFLTRALVTKVATVPCQLKPENKSRRHVKPSHCTNDSATCSVFTHHFCFTWFSFTLIISPV